MNFVIIGIKIPTQTPPIVLIKDGTDRLLLRKETNEIYLDSLNIALDNILTDMGSSIGNIIFLLGSEFQIDSSLEANTEKGFIRYKEPEQVTDVETTKTILGADEIIFYYFDDDKIARRFVEKKILGEIYLLNSQEQAVFPFYPLFREAYLFTSNFIEVGILGYLDCQNTLSAPSATATELAVGPTDKISIPIENTNAVFDLSIWKKYRLDFTAGSGMNVIKMARGKRAIKDGAGNVLWEIHDEIFKIYVA